MTEPLPPLAISSGAILSDEVYTTIGAAILEGRLRPGERLRDVDLAAQLGISRTPVREALQRLERFGLVEVAVGRYTRVSEPDDRLRADTAAVTVSFLGSALRLSLAVCSDDELDGILDAADHVIAAAHAGDRLRLFDASVTMFEGVTRATANSVFIGIMRETALSIQRNLRGWDPFLDAPLSHPEEYTTLRDRIAARDGAGAELTLRRLHHMA
ncbi:MAG: GntR family transcriptional regulator [Candidatus Microbacterium phytovorans]|uniref:GntR family transcriptional regulator n=1 Tax=Candidatus Microbacterium phytovorans TaxID=3121374 RepID=A0AAJ6B3N3_9MICO|nr:GntR family transcriptional regulator [Microbacterium sp.]WEK13219.1 MAG: GntR family transcriptional regulator [Microbacterium sp.]